MQVYVCLIVIIIGIISAAIILRNNKLKKSPDTMKNIEAVDKFLKEIEDVKKDYFTYIIKENLIKEYKMQFEFFSKIPYSNIKSSNLIEFKQIYSNFDSFVKRWNDEFVERELVRNKDIFDDIDGKSLDAQQRKAVVVDEVNNLVLAGAGSGKTLTISAKVKYLVDRKNILPEQILLISFTKKAATEMYQRISEKLGIDVEAKTFHKLGLDIITKHRKIRPDISDDLISVIDTYFEENIYKDKKQIKALITFYSYYLNIPKDLEEFDNLGECHDYYRNIDFETIKGKVERQKEIQSKAETLKTSKQTLQGETVKSLEELMIANLLFLNGINYTYEYKYPFPSDDIYRKQYRPDFYLNDYDIYLEHFGITRDNKVPWLSAIEEQKYLEGIKWKRETHKKNKTVLLETYSYYNREGILLSKLEEILKQHKVEFRQPDFKEIYSKIFNNEDDKYFIELKKLISTFIGLFKSNGFLLQSFIKLQDECNKIENTFLRNRSIIFSDIVKSIYIEYQEYLENNGLIDFNDMINNATDIVNENEQSFRYKYIIIDEYQDISMSRFNLIKAIRNITNAKIMCVGDDWQSVYRFTGSDIDLFTNFKTYLGYYELIKIENTYRNSQELINVVGNFIMKNPKQLKKDLKSNKHNSNPIRMLKYEKDIYPALRKAIDEIVDNFGEDAQITILGRNNFDINIIEEDKGYLGREFKLNKSKDQISVKSKLYPKLKMNFLTVHRSKGLEADNVIIINLENKLVGFPNKISDDPILSLVLTDLDKFDFAEERRLFYVALTRTKNTTYLIAPSIKQSSFVEELAKEYQMKDESSIQQEVIKEIPNCPKCQKGFLVIRENKKNNNKFLGCSNYPFCDLSIKHIEILNNHIKCSVCGGYMVKRPGRHGEFYGCTNYPYCKNTLKIDKDDIEKLNSKGTNILTEKNEINAIPKDSKHVRDIAGNLSLNSEIKSGHNSIKNENVPVKINITGEKKSNNSDTKSNLCKTVYKEPKEYERNNCTTANETKKEVKDKNFRFMPGSSVVHSEFGRGNVIYNDLKIIKIEFQNKFVISFSYETCVKERVIRESNNYIDSYSISKLLELSDDKLKMKEFDYDAIIINEKIIKCKKDSLEHYFRLAECYKHQNLYDEAIAIYDSILEMNKNNSEAKSNLSYLHSLNKTVHKQFFKNGYYNNSEDYYH